MLIVRVAHPVIFCYWGCKTLHPPPSDDCLPVVSPLFVSTLLTFPIVTLFTPNSHILHLLPIPRTDFDMLWWGYDNCEVTIPNSFEFFVDPEFSGSVTRTQKRTVPHMYPYPRQTHTIPSSTALEKTQTLSWHDSVVPIPFYTIP